MKWPWTRPNETGQLKRKLIEAQAEKARSARLNKQADIVLKQLKTHKESNGFTELMVKAMQGNKS